jgi:hypothetical protein
MGLDGKQLISANARIPLVCSRSDRVHSRQRVLFMIELALQDAQARIGQPTGIAPEQQLLTLCIDD